MDFSRYEGVDPGSETMASKSERGSLLVLSGASYRYDRPWLYYLTNLHLELGYSANGIAYQHEFIRDTNRRPILRGSVSRLVQDWAKQRMTQFQSIAAFSFGNQILGDAIHMGLKLEKNVQIFSLSPSLNLDEDFARVRKYPERTVFIIGEADAHAPQERVETLRRDGYRIWVVPNADHGLDDPHSVRRSIDNIRGFTDWLRPLLRT